uniref:Strawberry notch AAA domain-containing protein n=1 Tax=Trichuris muris TaxID=70415 RepID=A0A5S6QQW1_TRIMR
MEEDDDKDLLSAALSEAGIDSLLRSCDSRCSAINGGSAEETGIGRRGDEVESSLPVFGSDYAPSEMPMLQPCSSASLPCSTSASSVRRGSVLHVPLPNNRSYRGKASFHSFVSNSGGQGPVGAYRIVIRKPSSSNRGVGIAATRIPVSGGDLRSSGTTRSCFTVRGIQSSTAVRGDIVCPTLKAETPMTHSQPRSRLSRGANVSGVSQMFLNQGSAARLAMNVTPQQSRPFNRFASPSQGVNPSVPDFARRRVGPGSPYSPASAQVEDSSSQDDDLPEIEDVSPEEDFGLSHADTYSDYAPSKLRSGLPHPDPVVETSSLTSVQPPEIWYHISIPEHIVDTGRLSALQLETIIYACQQHEHILPNGERTGYLIGDGPGVGKGRTIAGIIYENYLLGRKRSIWFSVSSDLKYDAQRDLADVGADKIKVHALNKFKYSKISGKENGSVKKGVIFATYASLIGESQNAKSKYRTRIKQLLHWCGGTLFDGVIVLDECHRAKNLVPSGSSRPTKTGKTVMELQTALPKARIVYASATGATEPRHMAYMTRLGLWGEGRAFPDFNSFISAVERRGVGAMEIIAMDMKLRGLYLARQLSFTGVSFRVEEVTLSADFIHMYDESVKLWLEARRQFQLVISILSADKNQRKAMWGQFWAAHQRFFKYLCIAAKVKACVRLARESVRNGKCVVIGLQSTGEARTLEQLDEYGGELTDFVSTAKGVFQALIEKHFPSGENDFVAMSVVGAKRSQNSKRPALAKKGRFDYSLSDAELSPEASFSSEDSIPDEWDDLSESEGNSETSLNDKSDTSSDRSDQDSSSSSEEAHDSFNPFMLGDDSEEDPWEEKMKSADTFRKVQKRKHRSKSIKAEADGVQELIVKSESVVAENEVSANEFLHSGSSFLAPDFTPLRLASELGLSQVQVVKADLLAAVERLGEILPPNTLDELINELGGPQNVAEMTGRKGRVVSTDDGQVVYQLRNDGDVPVEMMNMTEKERFMNGSKYIAIISEAASSGISLHADRRVENKRRRVHITLELPWSADKAVQQFGRTHRSNQVNSPEYIFLISELAGEQRFASVVAKRLESLGALTHGDRRATETRDFSQFNLDTKYGRVALETTLKSILGWVAPIVPPPADYKGNFFNDMLQFMEGVGFVYRESSSRPFQLEKDINMTKFLNRILGLPVSAQNALFQYFSDTLKEVIEQAKRDGRYDLGILDLGQTHEKVKKLKTTTYVGTLKSTGMKTELHVVSVERGMLWHEAMDLYCQNMGDDDGFYISSNTRLRPTSILVCAARGRRSTKNDQQLFTVYKPYCSINAKVEPLSQIKQRYRKVLPKDAEPIWKEQYLSSGVNCQHVYWHGKCKAVESGQLCEMGKRVRIFHILSGSVVATWNLLEEVVASASTRQQNRMQVVRLRTDQNQKLVGLIIPNSCVQTLMTYLQQNSSQFFVKNFDEVGLQVTKDKF